MDCIYLDLKKAFDKVPHKRLLWKLKTIGGLRGTIWKWMEDYLHGREMRTVVRDEKSDWKLVTSGVPQGSVLAPIMFLIYVNDMIEGVSSYMSLFADDAKLLRKISNQEDCKELQKDLERICNWSKRWEMEFNTKKCHLLEMGKSEVRPTYTYKMGDAVILRESEEKDLGVYIQDNLSPEKHINKIFGDAFKTLRNMGAAFHYMDKEMMKKIFTTMIRPKLEYAAVVWSPYKKKHVRKLERIQRIATKMVPELRELTYEERLNEMNLPSLEDRRERGDLITVYKLMNNLEEIDRKDLLLTREREARYLRGHKKKLAKGRCLKNTKKYSFPQRTIDIWNGLSEETVTVACVHNFKAKLNMERYGDRTTRA